MEEFFNLRIFLQAVFWEKLNYSGSIFSKLFPFIDSFTGNPSRKHSKAISERAGRFLSQTPVHCNKGLLTEETIKSRVEFIWEIHRYPELHGHFKEPFENSIETKPHSDFEKDLFDLLEISRLMLLKMLVLEDAKLQVYSQIPIPPMALGPNNTKGRRFNRSRDSAAQSFFSHNYASPSWLVSYSDFTLLHTEPS